MRPRKTKVLGSEQRKNSGETRLETISPEQRYRKEEVKVRDSPPMTLGSENVTKKDLPLPTSFIKSVNIPLNSREYPYNDTARMRCPIINGCKSHISTAMIANDSKDGKPTTTGKDSMGRGHPLPLSPLSVRSASPKPNLAQTWECSKLPSVERLL